MIHTAPIDGTILWSIVTMSVAFAIGAGSAVWGIIGATRGRRHVRPVRVTVPSQRKRAVQHRTLAHR